MIDTSAISAWLAARTAPPRRLTKLLLPVVLVALLWPVIAEPITYEAASIILPIRSCYENPDCKVGGSERIWLVGRWVLIILIILVLWPVCCWAICRLGTFLGRN